MKKQMKISLLATAALLAMAGCKHEGSAIQKQYAADRAECREYAEMTVGTPQQGDFFPQAGTGQIELVRAFARCMHQRGWAVNKPPEEKKSDDEGDE